jgi:hypothetical protein
MGAPTSSYATAGIALRVSGALKPHHYDKVETPSVEFVSSWDGKVETTNTKTAVCPDPNLRLHFCHWFLGCVCDGRDSFPDFVACNDESTLTCWYWLICASPWSFVTFRNKLIFYGEEFLTPRLTPKLEDHPLWAFSGYLLNIAATLHILRPSPLSAT